MHEDSAGTLLHSRDPVAGVVGGPQHLVDGLGGRRHGKGLRPHAASAATRARADLARLSA